MAKRDVSQINSSKSVKTKTRSLLLQLLTLTLPQQANAICDKPYTHLPIQGGINWTCGGAGAFTISSVGGASVQDCNDLCSS